MIKLDDPLREAILQVMAFVTQATGTGPTQKEIASVLASHFSLGEVTNQIGYLQKRPANAEEPPHAACPRAAWRINVSGAPARDALARAGFFIEPIGESIAKLRKYAKAILGVEPSDEHIARSLISSFILSELKNQILYSRKNPPRKKP